MAHDQVADVAVGHIGHHGGVDSDNMGFVYGASVSR